MRVSKGGTRDGAPAFVDTSDLVLALAPFGLPSARLAVAAGQAGGLGVLDLTTGDRVAREELALAEEWGTGAFAVRLSRAWAPELPERARTVVLTTRSGLSAADFPGRRVLAEVTSREHARQAAARGVHGLIARGHEAGGHIGELSTFVLLQQLVADDSLDLPVWACGGIGPHTGAAAVAGGAAGVVLDTQLALLADVDLPAEITTALSGLDGSETAVVDGARVLRRALPGADDQRPIEIGQDGFLPVRFQRRWGTVSSAVRGMRSAILDALGNTVPALGAESAGSAALGTALPIAQGPMTRVSDQPRFAEAVADGGALPFIALALSGKAQTRAVLEQTRDSLGSSPWGVGVLGFAPDEVKAAQLEVISEIRPSHAIIAGGRPSQAAGLEELGISTFLHVPSPGLLRQFLEAGARKFIFEGSECGGHVGPRNSFPLWEAQLGVIDDFLAGAGPGTAAELQVFFAGGVHDERSAAMVAAMTAPLAQRGAAVGVLMGTAYLFTEEAVEAGAVLPGFQRQVISAERTDLLETAPGHATRCVHSPFTAEYAAIKEDLRAREVPSREAWEQLEQLNVGRLRLASKGIERVGDELRSVDADRQLAEGMFMAGEVAVLRSEVTTIAALHESVSTGALAFLADRSRELTGEPEEQPRPEPLDIAIVGMSCMFPDAPDLPTFWANVLSGADAVTEVPPQRWDQSVYYDPEGDGSRTPSRWGGFLPEIPFDPLAYGIPPTSLASIEPVQLLALQAARGALADAGYEERPFDRARTSVVFGAEAGSDLSNAMTLRTVLPAYLGEIPPALESQLPKLTEDSFPGVLANVIAGRIANRLDLGGSNYTVDAACASSLTAVDVACKELASGTSDLVLCGGADLHNGINDYLLFASAHALSPSGRSATFDSSADGIALGEGVACVALKRLADAERDGDRIYGVIAGVGSSSDGRALGLTAPRPEGQHNAVTRAYRNAGVSPAEVGLVEAHGTGTVVGDRTELTTLTRVFTEAGAEVGGCAISSVKSQIGHTKCAAGLAGLIKTALALHNGVKPPTLHLSDPNPAWERETSPFVFHTEARPWAAAPADRIAGVSAFGFGGTNFHVVVRAHASGAPPVHAVDEWPAELFTFRGADHESAVKAAREVLALAEADTTKHEPWRLRDLALSASRRGEVAAARGSRTWIAVVASTVDELVVLLRRAIAGEDAPDAGVFRASGERIGQAAFLFPGQGSQRPGMFADLFVAFPELQRYLRMDPATAEVLFPPTAFDEAGRAEQVARLTDTRAAQPALGIVGLAAHHLLGKAGVRPSMVAGHSYGELTALAAAGSLGPDALLRCSTARAEAILGATGEDDPGTMAAVSAGAAEVAAALEEAGADGSVVLANRNSPKQTVISGPTGAVDSAVESLRARGLGAKRIPVACAFHSPLVASASETFGAVLETVPLAEPDVPVWSNRTAARYPATEQGIRDELAAQIAAPVGFVEQIEAMYEAGARVFVEAGPGATLTKLTSAILGDRPHETVTFERGRRTGLPGFLHALARLAVAGADVRTGWLFRGRHAVDAARTDRPRRPGWTVDGHLVRTAGGSVVEGALHPAQRISEAIVTTGQHQGAEGQHTGTEALIAEFLRNSRQMVEAQRDVLLGYLGTEPVQARPPALAATPAPQPLTPAPQPTAAPTPEPAPEPQAEVGEESVLSVVLEVIGERTGYPVDMIEPDLDLEADLSVDSIKRAEIGGELATRLRLTGNADVDDLAKARTAASITELILAERGDGPAAQAPAAPAEPDEADEPVIVAPKRLVMKEHELQDAELAEDELTGSTFLVLGGGPVAEALSAKLGARGAEAVVAADFPENGRFDGVVHLSDEASLPDAFPAYQAALAGGPRWLLASGPAEGLRGFFRSVSREYPDTIARVVELGPDAADVADVLVAELSAVDREPVVRRVGGRRYALRMREEPLGALASTGAGPAGDGAAEAAAIGLDHESVVLLVGGAKGITARFATSLATASRCRIEIFGRTATPQVAEDPAIAAATTEAELRSALIDSGLRVPAEIERAVGRIQAEREVRDTLRRLADLGSEVRYHCVDMLNGEAVHQAVKEIHAEHGRIDGIVYAAGVIEDKLISEKEPESFGRVFSTKVDGARDLFDAVDQLPNSPRFAVLFGSIAAALGNRGQSDYAAANDALEAMGGRWSQAGRRGLTVHWGPWAPTGTNNGMVTPELMRNYAKRGIELIDPEEGTMSLLRELAWGPEDASAVVYTASGW